MSKGRKLLIALALLAILGAITLSLTYDREPTYAGHPLSYWLRTPGSPGDPEARRAVGAIGTNAIPYLIRWIAEEPPEWKKKLFGLPVLSRNNRLLQFLHGAATIRALCGFAILRTNAASAIPALVTIMNDPTKPNASMNAMSALTCLGEQALPPLTAVLSETNRLRRACALDSISRMPDLGTAKDACLAPLLKATTDASPPLRSFATNAILRIAPGFFTNSTPNQPLPPQGTRDTSTH